MPLPKIYGVVPEYKEVYYFTTLQKLPFIFTSSLLQELHRVRDFTFSQ
jgi:hypothetical protein